MEKLYNNIILPDDFASTPSDAAQVPYLVSPPPVIDVTVGRQLFVDDFLIERTALSPVYHRAKKYEGNPVLRPETPEEREGGPCACPKSGGVWYDEEEGLFKMWYEAGWLHHNCYATSRDGLYWERPDLGIIKNTNIFLPYEGYAPFHYPAMGEDGVVHSMFAGYEDADVPTGLDYFRPDSSTVFLDPDAAPAERYKLFLRNPGARYRGIVATSADGVHFENFRFTEPLGDRSTVFYNPFRKKWVYSIRTGWPIRSRNYRECDDLLAGAAWGPEEEHPWMAADGDDRPNPYIGYTPQLYNVDCVAYESIMLGMFQIMYGPENDVCEAAGVPKITELIPMYSRDGYHFSRPSRQSIIGASLCEGAWDRGYIQSVGGVTVIHGDELWIYYIGFSGDTAYAGAPFAWQGMYREGATGLATLRRDGFVSMEGKGELLTRPLTHTGKHSLAVNAVGSVTVEILSEDGHILARSLPFTGDSTCHTLSFPAFDLSSLNGQVYRLRFLVDGALYAFGLADEKGDFGGHHAAGAVNPAACGA